MKSAFPVGCFYIYIYVSSRERHVEVIIRMKRYAMLQQTICNLTGVHRYYYLTRIQFTYTLI